MDTADTDAPLDMFAPSDPAPDEVIDWVAKSQSVHGIILGKAVAKPAVDSSAVSVCVRVRPVLPDERELIGKDIPGRTASSQFHVEYDAVVADSVSGKVHVLSEARKLGKPTGKIATQVFTPHHVFGPNETDDAVYNTSVSPLVAHALAGGASTVIAYGATGAGKTHSMTAVQRLAAAALLAGGQHKLRLSFFELRGEGCYDLLHEQRELVLRDDGTGDIVVCGLQQVEVSSEAAVEAALAQGNAARATAPTAANTCSSRSHAICQLQLVRLGAEGEAGAEAGAEVGAEGSLRLVDLAGSERKDTGNLTAENPERLAEMKAINSSLGCLKECIRLQLLRDTAADDTHVPYRRCKLTTLLKSSFVNHAALPEAPPESVPRLCFLSHVAPLRSQGLQTVNTLTYTAQMVESSRADKEKAAFNEVERWTGARVVAWAKALEGGKYAHVADCFARTSGKRLSHEWELDVCKWVTAAGGTEQEGHELFEAFQKMYKEAKRAQRSARPKQQIERIVEPCVVGGDFMADGPRAAVAE